MGAKYLIDFFLKKPINRFIQIGSSLEYGRSKNPNDEKNINLDLRLLSGYSNSKLLTTKYLFKKLKKNKFPFIVLRPYLVYGPGQDFNRIIPIIIKASLNTQKFACTEGKQKRDFLYIDDLVRMTSKVIKSKKVKGKILNVGSGNRVSVRKIIEKIVSISKGGKPLYGKIKMRKEENLNMFPDISNTKKLLQWKANISLDVGLKKTINFYRWN